MDLELQRPLNRGGFLALLKPALLRIFGVAAGSLLLAIALSAHAERSEGPPQPRVAHVFVALCDNENQGIVKVSEKLGDGQDPANNLYWGAMYGVKTFFSRSDHWTTVKSKKKSLPDGVLQRCIFKLKPGRDDEAPVYVIADAYDGARMKIAIGDFLSAAAGKNAITVKTIEDDASTELKAGGAADLACFIGHNGLMDEELEKPPTRTGKSGPAGAMVLACKSKPYFEPLLKEAGCPPIVLTTGLMAPEAYALDAALRAWAQGKSVNEVRLSAATAYAKYQKCSTAAANHLFDAE